MTKRVVPRTCWQRVGQKKGDRSFPHSATAHAKITAVLASGTATPSTEAQRGNNIGTLRLIAALMVLFGHCFVLANPGTVDPLSGALSGVLPFGRGLSGQGVFFFFAISGYLVTRSFDRRGGLGRFLEARALRIFPALWGAILVTIAVGALVTTYTPAEFLRSSVTLQYIAHDVTLIDLRQFLPGLFADNPASEVNISLWTLPIELGMYGLVAVLGVAGFIRRRITFNAAVVVIFAVYLLGGRHLPILAGHHQSELALLFVAGASLYVNRNLRLAEGVAALALMVSAIVSSLFVPDLAPTAVVFAFASAVIWLGFNDRIRLPNLAARGDLSYGTYLFAWPVAQMWIQGLGVISPWPLVALTTAATLPLAWLSWWVVERPALSQKGRIVAGVGGLRRLLKRSAAEAPGE